MKTDYPKLNPVNGQLADTIALAVSRVLQQSENIVLNKEGIDLSPVKQISIGIYNNRRDAGLHVHAKATMRVCLVSTAMPDEPLSAYQYPK